MNKTPVKKYAPYPRAIFLAALLMILYAGYAEGAAKYVFLFIGDGMGTAQRNTAEIYLAGMRKALGDDTLRDAQLVMNLLPVQGFIKTNSLSGITDSAAGGTALATGRKTKNSAVSMNPDTGEKYVSIAEIAHRNGMKTGIVTSAFFQDATPAVFYGHAKTRTERYSLGTQLTDSGYEYFGGGGFLNPKGSDKKHADLYETAAAKGYSVIRDLNETPASGKVIAVHPRASNGYTPWAVDDGKAPSLADFVSYGIKTLDGGDGFFLMAEGGKIDLACHANDALTSIYETIAFDEAIERAVEFMNSRPESTLIVVTSDHETGGMTFAGEKTENSLYSALSPQQGSYAAFERRFSPKTGGKIDESVSAARKFFGPSVSETDEIKKAFQASVTAPKERKTAIQDYNKLYATYDPFTVACVKALNARAGITWTTFYHTGKNVPVSAAGFGAENFAGEYENTGVFDKILSAMEIAN